jgi:hypothetical protein
MKRKKKNGVKVDVYRSYATLARWHPVPLVTLPPLPSLLQPLYTIKQNR